LLCVSGSLAAPLLAQNVSVSVAAAVPLSVQVTDGSVSLQSSMAAGPLAPSGVLSATLPGPVVVTAFSRWNAASSGGGVLVGVDNLIDVGGASPALVGRAGPNEFVIQFTASAPTPARLYVGRYSQVPSGAAWPTVQIDFDNDGSIDIADLAGQQSRSVPTFGVQPLLVRIRMDASLSGLGQSYTDVVVELAPDNDLTAVPVAIGCSASGWPLALQPVFVDRGLDLLVWPSTYPTVFVLGLSLQPVLLPSMPWGPCLLVPSPDILLVPPPGATWLHVPLPAALRPVQFWVQAVEVVAPDLWTTDAYAVSAH
jgi:hypothetical protein